MQCFRLVGVAAIVLVSSSCGSTTTSSTAPSPPALPPGPVPAALDLTGNWSGTASDSQGPTTVAWHLTQTGSLVSGTVRTNAVDPNDGSCSSCHRNKSGTVSGTLAGSTLTLTMMFAAGADGDPTPACSTTLTASASPVSAADVSAAYSGSDTCEGAFANGTMTMKR